MKQPDLVVVCKKCEHQLYVPYKKVEDFIYNPEDYDCPNCGENGFENWVLSRSGDYDEEHT